MIDFGNDAMLAAAHRHYERIYSDDVMCAGCYEWFTPDRDTLHSDGEYFCGDTCARTKLWARDFVSEVLFEDEGERSVFFPDDYQFTGEVVA